MDVCVICKSRAHGICKCDYCLEIDSGGRKFCIFCADVMYPLLAPLEQSPDNAITGDTIPPSVENTMVSL